MKKGINLVNDKNGKVVNFGNKIISVLQLHREMQEMSDNMWDNNPDQLDITDCNPSHRYHDYIIGIAEPYRLTPNSFKCLKNGVIIQDGQVIGLEVNKKDLYEDYKKVVKNITKNLEN